jgi:hypothetical protein
MTPREALLHLSAVFTQSGELTRAIAELERAGFKAKQLEVISAEPRPDKVFLPSANKTRIGTFTVAGACLGGLGGFLLATLTALAYPLPTGGMPILAWWPIGIVAYEAMMLGAILSTLLGLLVELKLPTMKARPYDETVADGGLLLIVSCTGPPQFEIARRVVLDQGARLGEGKRTPR